MHALLSATALRRVILHTSVLFILSLTSNGLWAADTCKQLIATGNAEYPPFLWRDREKESRLSGANADLMAAVSKEINIPIEIRYLGSWARVQEEAKLGRVDLIAGAFYTIDRLDYMDYVYPAFQEVRSVVWARQSSPFKYKQWSDLKSLTGITVINNSFGQNFDQYAKNSLRISTVPSVEQALKMLQLGRVDYLVYEEYPAFAYIAKLELEGLVMVNPPVSTESLYLTLSHKSACNTPEVRAALARAMHKLTQQNVMKTMVETNLKLWRSN